MILAGTFLDAGDLPFGAINVHLTVILPCRF